MSSENTFDKVKVTDKRAISSRNHVKMRGYQLFEQINNEKHYFKSLNKGDLAANSDHYPFAKRHVPCIFLENQEGSAFPYYHTIYDNWQHAVFDSYEPVFRLVTDFINRY